MICNARVVQHVAFVATLALTLAASPANAESPADEAFEALALAYIEDLPKFSPVNATLLGDHRLDHELDQVDAAARERATALYERHMAGLDKIDRRALSRANQVDAALLRHALASGLWQIRTLQEWAWNPLYYVSLSGSSIYGLMARDFAPLPERLDDAAARMGELPRFLRQARESLAPDRVPKIHAETAILQNAGFLTMIDAMIAPALDAVPPQTRTVVATALDTAKDALAQHQTWLEEELLPRASGKFRLGAELFDTKLGFALNSPLGRREVRRRAEDAYVSVRNEMYDVARKIYAALHPYSSFPDDPDDAFKQVIIRAALEQAYGELPDPDGIVDMARTYLEQARTFVEERDIVTVPDEPIEIIVMPEFRRGVSLAYLDPPGPLDKGQKSFYAVAPLPADWNEEQVRSFLREYNTLSVQNLTIHEAMPGHYLQLALSNRYPSMLRALLWSGPFVEGWAVYAERVMVEAGYLDGDPLMRLIQLKWYLRAVTNAIIDQAIHVDGMTREAAMRLMVEGAFQEEREAAGKWVRGQLTSAQLSTYFVGYQEHIDMRRAVEAAWGDEFTLRRYHDQVLSYGSPPVRFVRALILDEEIPDTEP